ncbi:MAG: hypothetical protein HC915_21650 [Anaerolineae bacterium]|nr:hypothetical protein [Anaerolineae bacterium]
MQSLVSVAVEEAGGVQRTFKIVLAPPTGNSYAREIAVKYGISYEQLREIVQQRAE